ncbi:MAG: ATP-dependent RNA helicase RhlE [Sphingobacteriales bacterium]|jgi:ATP-dependent RNA helicase RhlE
MRFSDYPINPALKETLEKKGFKRPTDIQYKSISHILQGEDVLAIAQTGTGKTAAFVVPTLHTLHEKKLKQRRPDGVKCLVMVPTRELAKQIGQVFEELGKFTKVETFALYGGVEQDPQIQKLQDGVDILVSTPGRMFDLVAQGHLRLHRVEILILDEADHMLDLGFIKDIRDIITHMPKRQQTLFFSATIDKEIKKLAYSIVNKPIRIQVSPENLVAKNVEHSLARIKMDDKRFFLETLIKKNEEAKILVFVRTQVRAERVKKAMTRVEIESECIHGGMEQDERILVLDKFKSGELKLLIATDVSARGIDIPDVNLVVNYDVPDKAENYVHRVGRTGRGKARGRAVTFCDKSELVLLEEINEYIGGQIPEEEITGLEYDQMVNLSEETHGDWKTLLKKNEVEEKMIDAKRKKRRKKR